MKEGYEKKCYTCKKKFSTYNATDGWAYMRRNGMARRFFCSYDCMRKYDRKQKKEVLEACEHYISSDTCLIHGKIVRGCTGCKDYERGND
jgi:hypothetical protein